MLTFPCILSSGAQLEKKDPHSQKTTCRASRSPHVVNPRFSLAFSPASVRQPDDTRSLRFVVHVTCWRLSGLVLVTYLQTSEVVVRKCTSVTQVPYAKYHPNPDAGVRERKGGIHRRRQATSGTTITTAPTATASNGSPSGSCWRQRRRKRRKSPRRGRRRRRRSRGRDLAQ